MNDYIYTLEMKVRDYEIDSEGIVNNAVYLNYLENTRHEFCEWAGLSFRKMEEKNIIPVLNKVEIEYKTPLMSGDIMLSSLWIEKKGVRFIFHQDIFKRDTQELVVKAIVSCVCLENGKLSRGEMLADIFKDYLK